MHTKHHSDASADYACRASVGFSRFSALPTRRVRTTHSSLKLHACLRLFILVFLCIALLSIVFTFMPKTRSNTDLRRKKQNFVSKPAKPFDMNLAYRRYQQTPVDSLFSDTLREQIRIRQQLNEPDRHSDTEHPEHTDEPLTSINDVDIPVVPLEQLIFAPEAEQLAACGPYGSQSFTGLPHEPKESVVVVSMDGESEEEALGAVLRAFTDNDHANVTSGYQSFMRERRVSVTVPPALSPEDFRYDALSYERAARRALTVSALSMDVVYTYANPNSTSFRAAAAKYCGAACLAKNFRDFDELRYSMRAVERFVLGSDALTSTVFEDGAGGATRAEGVGRNVHVVVASADQVPAWVNRSHPRVRVVEHADTFGTFEDENVTETVPSMNSMAIETTLHRIGGLSRFYMYFNNDVIVTRPVSVFDYFRPLAPERQQLYRMFYGNGGYGDVLRSDAVLHPSAVGGGERREREAGQTRKRFAFFFESISYMENSRVLPIKSLKRSGCIIPKQCLPHIPLRTAALFEIPPVAYDSDEFLRYQQNTRQRFIERYDGAVPNGKFPHMALLFDRELMSLFLDRGMRDAARETRRQRLRADTSFLTGDVYPFFLTAVRRGIERKVIVERALSALRDGVRNATNENDSGSDVNLLEIVDLLNTNQEGKNNVWFRRLRGGLVRHAPDYSLCGPLYGHTSSRELQKSGADDVMHRSRLENVWLNISQESGIAHQKLHMDVPLTSVEPLIVLFTAGYSGKADILFQMAKELNEGVAPLVMTINDDFDLSPTEEERKGMKELLEAASRHLGPSSWEIRRG